MGSNYSVCVEDVSYFLTLSFFEGSITMPNFYISTMEKALNATYDEVSFEYVGSVVSKSINILNMFLQNLLHLYKYDPIGYLSLLLNHIGILYDGFKMVFFIGGPSANIFIQVFLPFYSEILSFIFSLLIP